MQIEYSCLKKKKNIVIWGTGQVCEQSYDELDTALDICMFCDSNPAKWCDNFKDGRPCVSTEKLSPENVVLITVGLEQSIQAISKELDKKGIEYCHITEAVQGYKLEKAERAAQDYYINKTFSANSKFVKYIDVGVPNQNCNFRCGYCYIRQQQEFNGRKIQFHSPQFIRAALSKERLGGSALINFCAVGETLLCPELLPIINEIGKEGHYISIVTNGTISKAFDEMLKFEMDLSNIFIKFSFHYLELKRLKLLEQFVYNVKRMWDAGCSITLEVIANDELIPCIDELKEFSLANFGALPHLLIPRNSKDEALDILTELSLEKFKETWDETFDSEIYRFKMQIIGKKQERYCKAGSWAFHLNLETGDLMKCVGATKNPYLCNIYEDVTKPIRTEDVGCDCLSPYCYNGHAYLSLGLVKGYEAPTYYAMRDRVTPDGRHWVSEKIKNIFEQKLWENNKGD